MSRTNVRRYPCLRCGIGVTELRGLCVDCQSVTRLLGEMQKWTEPREERRARMSFLNQIGRIPGSSRDGSRSRQRRRLLEEVGE